MCNKCEVSFEKSAIEALAKAESNKKSFHWEKYKLELEGSKELLEQQKTYTCTSCGAEIVADENAVSLTCPYCENKLVLNDRINGGLKPNYIIPFSVDKPWAEKAIYDHIKARRLRPTGFVSRKTIGKMQGIYVPFWLFSAVMGGEISFDAKIVNVTYDEDHTYTETNYYLLEMEGEMKFSKIPVDAGSKMDDDLMDALEPYDYTDVHQASGECQQL